MYNYPNCPNCPEKRKKQDVIKTGGVVKTGGVLNHRRAVHGLLCELAG
jgi:hypothetical protein